MSKKRLKSSRGRLAQRKRHHQAATAVNQPVTMSPFVLCTIANSSLCSASGRWDVRKVPEADVPSPHLQFIEQQTTLGLRGSSMVNNGHLAKMADAWAGPW
jgi:hypothetical protein